MAQAYEKADVDSMRVATQQIFAKRHQEGQVSIVVRPCTDGAQSEMCKFCLAAGAAGLHTTVQFQVPDQVG